MAPEEGADDDGVDLMKCGGRQTGQPLSPVRSREQEEREWALPQKEQTWRLWQDDMEQVPVLKLLHIIPFCSRMGRAQR